MKFKSLLSVVAFIPTLVMAQGAPKVEAPVAPKAPSAGIPGANGGGVKPVAPIAVNPPPKPAPSPQQQAVGSPASEAKSKVSEYKSGPKTDFAIAGAQTISDSVSQAKAKAEASISTRTIDKKEVIKKINQAETQQ
jgi:hypothetical protein